MSRLIDADLLKAEFKKKPSKFWHYIGINEMIDCAPTAYDTDNVIEQLESEASHCASFFDGYYTDDYERGKFEAYNEAVEIVKRGGVE